ncbi:hypothetical protein KTT_39220 [Tengunoibacter tsumagoiensis]|uniref:Uncharacterized protein n=1 Tax=Tengunoibacter tsumagoiensis TaxID=2014871 RepID=A0A402A4J3_9CHLR|nr:hypothetical protein KTT_39220 [Tengunoibacter tsumagoiensis]
MAQDEVGNVEQVALPNKTTQQRPVPVKRGGQGLWMEAFVALGCWMLAFTFVFFTQDANRYLFAGIAALMALVYSFMFVVRFRTWRQKR